MASKLTKRPSITAPSVVAPSEDAITQFLNKAPDSTPEKASPGEKRKGVMRGNREQISHTIPPDLLAKVDDRAKLEGQTRAGLINLAISKYLKE